MTEGITRSAARKVVLGVVGLFCVLLFHGPLYAADSKVNDVIIVCKQHFDIGYTDFAHKVLDYYRGPMFDSALKAIDATREAPKELQFVWTVPGWPMKEIVGAKQQQARREKILDALRQGRVVIHALPGTTHTESLDLESYVRGLVFSSRLCRELELPLPRDAKMTDVPCHAWITPTLLHRAGVEFFHFGGNMGCRQPETPPLFWWEGPDGSRVLTMRSRGYGTKLTPPADWPYSAWLCVMHTGDNAGPPDPGKVKEMLAKVREALPNAKPKMGRLSDFYDAIMREGNPEIPVVRGDMPDPWIYGIMSLPRSTKLIGEARADALSLMMLQTHLSLWGMKTLDLRSTLDAFYEKSFLYSEHTWGGATWKYFLHDTYGEEFQKLRAGGAYKTFEATWDEHREYARSAAHAVQPPLANSLKTLANSIAVAGERIVVFNPLPFERDGLVQVSSISDNFEACALVDAILGETVEFDHDKDTLRFVAQHVPPCGYRTYRLVGNPKKQDHFTRESAVDRPLTLENAFYRVTIDPERGGIVSLVDQQHKGHNWITAEEGTAFGQYLYEQFSVEDRERWLTTYCYPNVNRRSHGKPHVVPKNPLPHSCVAARGFKGILRESPIGKTVVLRRTADDTILHDVTLTFSLHDELPYLDIECTIERKPAEPWPEAGWLSFEMNEDEPRFHAVRLGAVVDPAKDFVRGSSRRFFGVSGGVSCTGDTQERGMVVYPIDSPLVSLGERGLWHYTPGYVPTQSAVYVNLYNNLWATNFAQWIEGGWTSRVRVWITGDHQRGLVRGSRSSRIPLLAARGDGMMGKLPLSRAGLTVLNDGLVVTAFGPNPDGKGNLLRLWDLANKTCQNNTTYILLPKEMARLQFQPCDLRGRLLGTPVSPTDGCLPIVTGPSTPSSLIWNRNVPLDYE